ncbi:MAG TPA: DUF429 domain-containing protein [Jatrophihabitans sp.]|nr:DUF429 domain-containing protein [Jatrophihabitans sp.]
MPDTAPPVTVGIDLASQPERTAICWIDWTARHPEVHFEPTLSDPDVVELIARAAALGGVVGMDSPLGWPVEFVNLVHQHVHGELLSHFDTSTAPDPPAAAENWRDRLKYRLTDRELVQLGHLPLSVSTDKLAVVALRCAKILDAPQLRPLRLDRSGRAGPVREVYPAASLRSWGLTRRGVSYKTRPDERRRIVAAIDELMRLPDSARVSCEQSHDHLDALVAALSARAAGLGRTRGPDDDQLALARVEGWIHVPTGALAELLS